jgi:hypothetical protein
VAVTPVDAEVLLLVLPLPLLLNEGVGSCPRGALTSEGGRPRRLKEGPAEEADDVEDNVPMRG